MKRFWRPPLTWLLLALTLALPITYLDGGSLMRRASAAPSSSGLEQPSPLATGTPTITATASVTSTAISTATATVTATATEVAKKCTVDLDLVSVNYSVGDVGSDWRFIVEGSLDDVTKGTGVGTGFKVINAKLGPTQTPGFHPPVTLIKKTALGNKGDLIEFNLVTVAAEEPDTHAVGSVGPIKPRYRFDCRGKKSQDIDVTVPVSQGAFGPGKAEMTFNFRLSWDPD